MREREKKEEEKERYIFGSTHLSLFASGGGYRVPGYRYGYRVYVF